MKEDFHRTLLPQPGHSTNNLRVMKLTAFLLLALALHVTARTVSQTVTFSGQNVSLVKVFNEVKRQTGYLIAYNDQLLKQAKPVTVSVKNEPVEQFIQRVLSNQPFEYAIEANTIFIRRKLVTVTRSIIEQPLLKTIKGRVVTTEGQPLQGVNVRVRGKETGTSTDANGNFSFAVDESATTLIFSYVGYADNEVSISNRETVNVVLQLSNKGLNEVVVVGYGTIKKADVTTAVSTITSKEIANRPVMGVLEAMAGQMAGVDVQQGGGQPGGASMMVRIRGTNSISSSSEPLYVVDGVPMTNALTAISINDIESVTVLKDVSSTAIYGSRGSSGVVLITTKRARIGAPSISVNSSVGMQQISRKIPMMGRNDYIQLLIDSKNNAWVDRNPLVNKATDNNAVRQAGGAAGNLNFIIPDGQTNAWGTFKYNILDANDVAKMANTDWQDEIYRNALVTQNELSISGGTENTRYVITGNYEKQDGIVINSTYQRFNTRAFVETKVRKNLTVGLQMMANSGSGRLQAQGRNESLGGWGVNLAALTLAPVFPLINPDGTYPDMKRNPEILGAGQQGFNPLELANNRYHYEKAYGFSAFGFAEWEVIPNLKYKLTINGQFANNESSFFEPSGVNDYGETTTGTKSSNLQSNTKRSLIENLLNYNITIGKKNDLALLGGYTIENVKPGSIYASANNAPTNYVQLVTGTPLDAYTRASENTLTSYLGRVRYNYDDRYLLTGAVRWDGSSRFSPGNKWGFFPSVSAGWNISKEAFMKHVTFFSDLKIRGGWGISGNNSIGDFEWQGNVGSNWYPLGSSQTVLQGVPPGSRKQNDDLTWEKTREYNIGFDVGLFKNRIFLSGDYYKRTSYDLLLYIPTPIISGQTQFLTNTGKMSNTGVELTLSTKNLVGNFKWTTDFNISHNVNKVLELGPGNAPILPTSTLAGGPWFKTMVGYPLSGFWGYQVDGIFQDAADLAKHIQVNPGKDRPGQMYFRDISGPNGKPDGVIDANDRTIIGDNYPDFTAGMTNHFSYKNFTLDLQLTGSQGGQTYSLFFRELVKGTNGSRGAFEWLLDRWKSPDNPGNGKVPDVTTVNRGLDNNGSSYWVQDNSYLRIRNLTFGYDFNNKLLKKINVSKLKIYASAYNLYTLTHYLGYDPEANTSYYYDSASGGGSTVRGADMLAYPTSRTFSLGLNLTF